MRKSIVLYIALAIPRIQSAEKKNEPWKFRTEIDIPSKKIKGTVVYTITPASTSSEKRKKTIPILIERNYNQPTNLQDEVMVNFPKLEQDVKPFSQLVTASKAYLKAYEPLFLSNNGDGNSEEIKKIWERRIKRNDRKRMLVYYRKNKNQKWKIVGEVGLNGLGNAINGREIFYWKGVQSHLVNSLKLKKENIKGVISTAVTGLISYLFATETNLQKVLSYTDMGNMPSKKMLENIGFTDTEEKESYLLHSKKSNYAIYTFTKEAFKEKYQHMTVPQYNKMYHPYSHMLFNTSTAIVLLFIIALWGVYIDAKKKKRKKSKQGVTPLTTSKRNTSLLEAKNL